MLNKGKEELDHDGLGTKDGTGGLPVMLIESDDSGCSNPGSKHGQVDHVSFPRLAWHTPSTKFGSSWCKAIGMVGYDSWNSFHNKHTYHDTWFFDYTWDHTFKKDELKHPWTSKINKALWRGSTTGPEYLPFEELSRAKLVKKSIDRPDLLDFGFTSFVQSFESQKGELSNSTRMANPIRFIDQMKYRAIVDIDGNTWSSRFTRLLCMNSVVIKVCCILDDVILKRITSLKF